MISIPHPRKIFRFLVELQYGVHPTGGSFCIQKNAVFAVLILSQPLKYRGLICLVHSLCPSFTKDQSQDVVSESFTAEDGVVWVNESSSVHEQITVSAHKTLTKEEQKITLPYNSMEAKFHRIFLNYSRYLKPTSSYSCLKDFLFPSPFSSIF